MRDFVWVLGNRSKLADAELGWSMRSVKKYVAGVGDFVVIGDVPRTDPGVPYRHIPAEDPYPFAQRNTLYKTMVAATYPLISDNFVLMNDDFFVLHPVNSWDIPTFRLGMLREHLEARCETPDHYSLALAETMKQLELRELPSVDYEAHRPMPLHKASFRSMVQEFNFYSPAPPLWRSCYGNMFRVNTVPTLDFKISEPFPMKELERQLAFTQYCSCGDGAFAPGGDFREFLNARFPK